MFGGGRATIYRLIEWDRYAYDTFWPYAYDDVLIGLYGAYYPAYSDPVPDPNFGSGGTRYVFGNETGARITSTGSSSGRAPPPESARQICSGQIEGLLNIPSADRPTGTTGWAAARLA